MDEPATATVTEYEPPCGVHSWNPTVRYGLLGCTCRDPLDLLGDQLASELLRSRTAQGPIYGGFRSGLPPISYAGLDLRGKQFDIALDYPDSMSYPRT